MNRNQFADMILKVTMDADGKVSKIRAEMEAAIKVLKDCFKIVTGENYDQPANEPTQNDLYGTTRLPKMKDLTPGRGSMEISCAKCGAKKKIYKSQYYGPDQRFRHECSGGGSPPFKRSALAIEQAAKRREEKAKRDTDIMKKYPVTTFKEMSPEKKAEIEKAYAMKEKQDGKF